MIFLELSLGCKSTWAKVHLHVLGLPVSLRKGQLDFGSLASPDEDCLLVPPLYGETREYSCRFLDGYGHYGHPLAVLPC